MVERAKPVMRAIKLTPPRPSARASSATNRRRLCSFRTGAICRYRLRAARACAARIMHPSYVARFLAVNPLHAFLRRLWQHRLSCLWTGPKSRQIACEEQVSLDDPNVGRSRLDNFTFIISKEITVSFFEALRPDHLI